MVGNLGRLLRSTLYSADVDIVPLDSELAALEPYLEIEKVRLGERLETSIRLGPEAGERMVPVLLLQPLVENAIRHGVAKRTGKGTVRVTARTWRDGVFLRVRDRGTGKSCDRPPAPGEGIALSNIVARMETLYGGAGRLDVRVRNDGATARVFIPPLKDLSVGGASC